METTYESEKEKLHHIIYVVKNYLINWVLQGKNGGKKPSEEILAVVQVHDCTKKRKKKWIE